VGRALPGRAYCFGRDRQLWNRADSAHLRGAQPPADRQKGQSNARRIIGAKLALSQWGEVVAWGSAGANVADLHFKHLTHRAWTYLNMHLAFAVAAFNLPCHWHGLQPNEQGFIPLSIAEFSL
jgi:uncharacterized membrane protein YsdA (DUF1294 family)